MGAWDTLLLTLQRRRTRHLAIAATLATLATTQLVLATPRHLLPWGRAGEDREGPRPYYTLQDKDTDMAIELANSVASMKGVMGGTEWREEEGRGRVGRDGRGRAPLLTVPTRRADHELHSGSGRSGRRGERPGEARGGGVEGGLRQVVRNSLARHGAARVGGERREGQEGRDEEEIVVGEEVGRVRELGVDQVVQGKGREASLGDMLKTGLNTFNTIQGLAQAMGGKGGKGGSGGSSLASMVGSLLLPPGQGGRGRQGRGRDLVGPLVDSAAEMLGGQEVTGGVARYAKPLLASLLHAS